MRRILLMSIQSLSIWSTFIAEQAPQETLAPRMSGTLLSGRVGVRAASVSAGVFPQSELRHTCSTICACNSTGNPKRDVLLAIEVRPCNVLWIVRTWLLLEEQRDSDYCLEL